MGSCNANRIRDYDPTLLHNTKKIKAPDNVKHIQVQIDRHWEFMPREAKKYLLKTHAISFHKLAKFWSSPYVVGYTRGDITGTIGTMCGTSWFIALNYLRMGNMQAAMKLTLNGAFFHQCFETPIEKMIKMCGPNFDLPIHDDSVPLYSHGLNSMRTPRAMEDYLQSSQKYQHMISFNTICPDNIMKYVGEIRDDWSGSSPAKSQRKPSSKIPNETQIRLILVDGTNEGEYHSFDIGSSTTLRTLFNDYADKRGVSLRSLRFSHGGEALFLSSVGNQSPEELNMRDQGVITVHDAYVDQETDTKNRSRQANQKTSDKVKKPKNSSRRTKSKCKKEKHKPEEPAAKTIEEFKTQHSKLLSKLNEEVEHQLKGIRMRLNALELERQPPKQKRKNKRKEKAKTNTDLNILPNPGVGGKAGRSHFIVQVGEVQNLYKTTKQLVLSQQSACIASALDLHGCTIDEALTKLDESLKVWVDAAMHASYPFVITAVIVCGCGSQVLSETVEKWIQSSRNVCNARKNLMSRNKFSHAAL